MTQDADFLSLSNGELQKIQRNMSVAFETGRGVRVKLSWRAAAFPSMGICPGTVRDWSGIIQAVEEGTPYIQFKEIPNGQLTPFPFEDCEYNEVLLSFESHPMEMTTNAGPKNTRGSVESVNRRMTEEMENPFLGATSHNSTSSINEMLTPRQEMLSPVRKKRGGDGNVYPTLLVSRYRYKMSPT